MTVENVTNIDDLNPALPGPADPKSEGDDHLRNIKKALQDDFAGFTGAICVTGVDGGAANAYTLTPDHAPPAYGLRMSAVFSPIAANTGASTMNIAGLGVVPIVSVTGAALQSNDLQPGCIYIAIYDGTSLRLASVTMNAVLQLAYNTVLPGQPGGQTVYNLVSVNGAASWQPAAIFSNPVLLAQAQATALCF